MKKVLFYLSVMGLVGCSSYTVKNDWTEEVKAGQTTVATGKCADLSNDFFGFFGDYPITITTKDGEAIASNDKEKEYEAAHWVVKADGSIEKATEACEVEQPEEEATEPAEEEATEPAEEEATEPAEEEATEPAEEEAADTDATPAGA